MILRTLWAGPPHGYAIAKRIREASEEGLEIEDGSLCPALNRMLVKGWLAARFYRLTPDGREQLTPEAEELTTWCAHLVRAIQNVLRTA